jgi:uncharacterized membrane protein (UPF0127 family)
MGRGASFLTPIATGPGQAWSLRNRRTGQVVAARLLPAVDSATRRKGLLGRASLGAGEAMVIAPSSAVHTFWMQFAIDIAFVRKDGTVLKTREAVGPWRMTGAFGAHAVVELEAGALARHDTKPGDVLELVVPAQA